MNEVEYVFELIRSLLYDTPPCELPDGVTFDSVYKLASDHSISNMIFYAVEKLKKQPEGPLLSSWAEARDKALVADITQLSELELIKEAFTENNIRFLPLKGSILKWLYPQTDMRTMSDIDILIDEENAEKVKEIMVSLGYTSHNFGADVDDLYSKPPYMNIEVHRRLFGNIGNDFADVFSDPWSMCLPTDKCEKELCPEAFLAYIIAHGIKHYNLGGTGIRSFLDVFVYICKEGPDIEKTISILEGSGQSELARDFIKLSQVWFGDEKATDRTDKMTEYILTSGTYGTMENEAENKIKTHGRAGYVLCLLFPSMEYMKELYPIVRKYPFLYPVFWVVRLVTRPFKFRRENLIKLKRILKK